MASKIIVAVDGSADSLRAVVWCANSAPRLGLAVVAVHALEVHVYPLAGELGPTIMAPIFNDADRAAIHATIRNDWCKPLLDAGVDFEIALVDGYPAAVVQQVAEREHAELVVAGRRGQGGFAELILGSTTHALTHHLRIPLVIVP